ncbi:MAG: site-specific integrase [Alphaproteobacteria bacterium]|nr:site-specific integrase [Alphaproteobacteria bacterium]
MTDTPLATLKGRPKKYAEYERLYTSLPKPMKRPSYVHNIGILRGISRESAYVKICMTNGGVYGGKTYGKGDYVEINLGKLSSFNWKQLEDRRDELQGKADRGEQLEETPMVTFTSYGAQWLERAKTRVKSYKTLKFHVDKYLNPTFGNKPLDGVTTSDVNNWIAKQRKTLNPATVKRTYNTLRAIFNDAIRSGVIQSNPCNNSDRITGIISRQRFLEADEVLALYSKAKEKSEWLADFILWAVHSGMRKTEIRNLAWEDIRRLPDGRAFATIKTSKSGKPRIIPCTPTMIEILERQKKLQKEGRNAIFPITEITLRRHWMDLRTKANLSDVVIHDFRRTHSSHVAAANVDLNTLAARLGHSDLTMLQQHYAMIVGSAETKATQTIEQVFGDMLKPKPENTTPSPAKKSTARKYGNPKKIRP